MAKVSFTTKGYIEAYWLGSTGPQFISRHRQETEAVEAITAHAESIGGEQSYELRYPNKVVKAYGILAPEGDTTAPSAPADASGYALNAVSGYLYWSASTDEVGVVGYQVWNGGTPVDTTTDTFYTVTGLSPSTAYTFRVTAYDAAGNHSDYSSDISFTTEANAAPVWSIDTQALTTSVAYSLSLLSVCSDSDNDPITFSTVSGSFPPGVSANYTAKTIGGTPTTVGNYSVVVRASDGINYTDQTISFEVLNADTTAPSVPTNLAGAGEGGELITLTWTASSDTTVANARTSGLAGYKVYRDGSLRATLGVVTTYNDSTVAANTDYSYTLSAYDAAGNESAQTAAVVVSTAAFGWTIPDTPLSIGNYVEGVGGTYDLSQHANTTSGTPVYSIVSATKGEVAGSYDVQVNDSTGLLTVGTALTADTYAVVIALSDATADNWSARINDAGVVWYHDFTEAGEFSAFDYTAASISLPNVRATSRVASGGPNNKPFLRLEHPQGGPLLDVTGMQWVSSNTADGCRVTVSLGSETLSTAGIVAGDWVQFVNMPTGNAWNWYNPHSNQFAGNLYVQVMSVVNATQFIVAKPDDMQGATIASYPAFSAPMGCAVHRFRQPSGRWARTLCAYNSPYNGKSTADPGANGTVTRRSWSSILMMNGTAGSRNAGMYGNAVYHNTWTGGINGVPIIPSDWDGSEWYLQFRCRMSSSRFNRGQPAGKLMIMEWSTEACDGEIVPQSYGKYPGPNNPNWKTAAATYNESTTVPWYAYYGKPTSVSLVGTNAGNIDDPMLPGSEWAATCGFNTTNGVNDCWYWPTDEWVTILMHFVPGRDSGNKFFGRGGSSGSTAYPETRWRVWAARSGQPYSLLFDRADFAWSWNQDGGTSRPPGFNLFSFHSYMNNIAGTDAFYHDFAEIIFSKAWIPEPTT